MPDDNQLPTIGQLVSNWLGVQLPAIALPQTLKNVDKAVGKVVLAAGGNLEARIKGNTDKVKASAEIGVDELFRTEEEKRKFGNRAAATRAALEDLDHHKDEPDAQAEIEDDWLNLFVRIAEDKSSDELQRLFGRILSGEIRKPGAFSLRTLQFMATMSRQDAETLSIYFPTQSTAKSSRFMAASPRLRRILLYRLQTAVASFCRSWGLPVLRVAWVPCR